MKVVIQRPCFPSGPTGGLSYVNSFFEAKVRRLDDGGWHVLEGLQETGERLAPGGDLGSTPILHKGFFDSHLHLVWAGLYEIDIDLRTTNSFEEAVQMVRRRLKSGPAYVRGYGWDENRWGMTPGSLARLAEESLPEDVPLILYRVCGHSALANRALRQKAQRPDLPALVTDVDLPTVAEMIPHPGISDCETAFLRAQARAVPAGLSAVSEMSLDETSLRALRNLAESGRLLIDVVGVVEGGKAPSIESSGPIFMRNASGLGPMDRPAVLSVQHWKKYLDGSLGARTAWLSKSYADFETVGEQLQPTKALIEASREALLEGFYLSFHAIGDAALDQALEVGHHLRTQMAARLDARASSLPRSRHRLEHAQVIRDDQIALLREQAFWLLCVQPHHRVSDNAFARARLGEARVLQNAYRAGALARAGVPLALSSDAPVDDFMPAAALSAVMTHPQSTERLFFDEAVWAYTTGGRLHAGLEPGLLGKGATVFLTENPLLSAP
ncbi:MAG: amidohydrolase family protein [Bdellovibrionales bacterium]|nr:amidohydrolase family protein [Bdellovibrionales bacterium]